MTDPSAVAFVAETAFIAIFLLAMLGGLYALIREDSVGRADQRQDAAWGHQERMTGLLRPLPAYPMLTHLTQTISPHYAPHNEHPALPGEIRPALPAGETVPLELPGIMELGQVLGTGWHPSPQSILLGLGPGGKLLTVPAGDALCHITFAGPTGVGKTNLMRLFLTQLLAAGCEVWMLDPHFTPRNPTTGEDWRPIAARLAGGQGAVSDKGTIIDLLEDVTRRELPARLARWHRGQAPGPSRFYAIEEAPALADHDKRFMECVRPLLREGRKLGLYVIMASQDMLVSTLGTSSGVRAQFQTCYYGGGDPYSAKALLGRVPPNPPGKGVVYLRSSVTPDAELVRVPLVSNDSIARLLPAEVPALPGRWQAVLPAVLQGPARPATPAPPANDDPVAGLLADLDRGATSGWALSGDQQQGIARRLWQAGTPQKDILWRLYRVKPSGTNPDYATARDRFQGWRAAWTQTADGRE